MKEIKVANEVVEMSEVIEYAESLFKSYGVAFRKGAYELPETVEDSDTVARVNFGFDFDSLDIPTKTWKLKNVRAVIATRVMKEMTVKEMVKAADFMKACAKIAEAFNDRMDGVTVNAKF